MSRHALGVVASYFIMTHSHFLVELLYGPLGPENGPQLAEHIIGYSAKSGEYISGSWQFELLARHTTKKKI